MGFWIIDNFRYRITIRRFSTQIQVQLPFPEWAQERPGFAYLTFVIADMSEVVKRLKEKGVKLVSAEPVEVRKGGFALYTLDP